MKTRMLLLALLLVGFSNVVFGAWIEVNSPIADQVPMVNVQSSASGAWRMDISIPGVTHETFSQEGNIFDRVSLPMEMMAGADGEAELPVVSRMIALRMNGNPEIEIVSENWVELDGTYELAPDMENERVSALASVYAQRDDYLPEASFVVTPRQIMGGVSLAVLQVRVAKYNPVQQKIMVLENAEILIHETGSAVNYNRQITETTAGIIKAVVPNWEDVLLNVEIVKGSYLYILGSNSLEDEAEPLATWRTRKGYTVEVAGPNEIGTMTTSTIKSFIQGRYNSADPPLEFVCLLGDEDDTYAVPSYYISGGIGDWQYSCLEGGDVLPDVHIGRFCFDTVGELVVIVDKTCNYEKYPASPTTPRNWYTGAGCIAGEPYLGKGVSTVQTMRWNRERMLDAGYTSTYIDTVYHTNPGEVDDDDITASFNAGSSLICYRGGLRMESYAEDDIALLSNQMRLPFMVTISCGTNDFNYDTGTGAVCELLLKAGTVATPKGVIGAIGTSSMGTHTRFNNCLMGGAIQGLLREGLHTMGGALTRSKVELYINYPVDPYDYVEDFCQYESLLGDPAVDIFTDTPEQLYADNPSTASIGINTLTLTVTGESAQPIEGVYVNLVKGTEVFVGDWTDASGQVVLNFETTGEDSLFVTATKHNCRPAINSTWVTSSARYVSPATSAFASVNPAETVELAVPLKNWGTSTAEGVEATLSITDPFVASISDSYENYGNIGAGATDTPPDDFDFTVADFAPDGYELQFELTVTDDVPNTWMSAVVITVSNGDFEYNSYLFSGDGILDPGESGNFQLTLDNIGTRTIDAGTVGYLRSGNSAVTVDDTAGVFSEATPGGQCSTTDHFALTATANAFPGERIPLTCIIPLDNGFADTVLFSLIIGSIASTSPTPPDSHGYWAFDNTDVAFDKHPTYSWVEIDPDHGGSGDVLNISDEADEDDASAAIELPFTFTYYGQDFDSISVCSNGWLAMGADQVMHTTFRNRHIPGALGPSGMIAPFWDDLWTSMGGSVLSRPGDERQDELFFQIQDLKHQGLYDAELWNEYFEQMNDGKSSGGHFDEGGETCASAPAISTLPYTDTGYTSNNIDNYYVGEWGAGCPYSSSSAPDVVYAYTPSVNTTVVIDLAGSSYDTKLYVYDNCTTENVIACDDDGGDNYTSIISSLTLTGGVTYYIVVDGYGSSSGDYDILVDEIIPPQPSGVYSYHDAANHRFIIEWSRVLKYDGSLPYPVETFECILYEPGYPATPTGDGEILFQYYEVHNTTDVGTSNDYATVGIENLTETDGVLYSFFNQAGPGAASMTDGRAILFTTQKAPPGDPEAPENLTAMRSGNDIELRWDEVTEDISGNPITVTGYNIYRDTTPGFTPSGGNLLDATSNLYYTDTGGVSGSKYFYVVQATY